MDCGRRVSFDASLSWTNTDSRPGRPPKVAVKRGGSETSHAGTGSGIDGRRNRLLDAHSAAGHARRGLFVVTSHNVARRMQADRVEDALLRGPIDDHFDASIYGQGLAALKTDACAAQVKDRTDAPL
jgi:hypothetical protein